MNEVIMFKTFCLEQYKFAHGLKGSDALRLFNQYGVMDYIGSFYDVLHAFGSQYIVSDIEEFIAARQMS